jgi:hypothetical protein
MRFPLIMSYTSECVYFDEYCLCNIHYGIDYIDNLYREKSYSEFRKFIRDKRESFRAIGVAVGSSVDMSAMVIPLDYILCKPEFAELFFKNELCGLEYFEGVDVPIGEAARYVDYDLNKLFYASDGFDILEEDEVLEELVVNSEMGEDSEVSSTIIVAQEFVDDKFEEAYFLNLNQLEKSLRSYNGDDEKSNPGGHDLCTTSFRRISRSSKSLRANTRSHFVRNATCGYSPRCFTHSDVRIFHQRWQCVVYSEFG